MRIRMQHRPRNFIVQPFRGRTRKYYYGIKNEEHKEPSVTHKVTSYFNIFKCGRNILDRLDVMYQREFMATPAENEYYKEMLKSLIKANNEGGKLCNENLRQSVFDLRAEMNVKHKRNINNITCDDLYQSHMKNNMYKQSTIPYIMNWMST